MRDRTRSATTRPDHRRADPPRIAASDEPAVSWSHGRWNGTRVLVAHCVLLLAGGLAYSNSFAGRFVLDDTVSILENPTIRSLSPGPIFRPPATCLSVLGRPLVNLSFAVNYALGGTAPFGYHFFNLAVHLATAAVLFALLKDSSQSPAVPLAWRTRGDRLAWLCALLWVVHPLTTEGVTYIVQRSESLMTLCYVSALWCGARGATSRRRFWWQTAAVVLCYAAMACKETAVSLPVMVLLYDRVFRSLSLRQALRERAGFHAALATSWVWLAGLVALAGDRGKSAGVALGMSPWQYASLQPAFIARYLWLSVWPDALVFDYGYSPDAFAHTSQIVPLIVIAALACAAVWAWSRCPPLGFIGCLAFVLLAPTSSFVPLPGQLAAERRMYFPLVCVVVGGVGVLVATGDWASKRFGSRWPVERVRRLAAVVAVAYAVVLGGRTFLRNQDYATPSRLWESSAAAFPENARAQVNWADALLLEQRPDLALGPAERGAALDPRNPKSQMTLANVLLAQGDRRRAADVVDRASRLPNYDARTLASLSGLYGRLGQLDRAVELAREATRIDPNEPQAHANLAAALEQKGDLDAALDAAQRGAALPASDALAHYNLARILELRQQFDEALGEYTVALRLDPGYASAWNNRGLVKLDGLHQPESALDDFNHAVSLRPERGLYLRNRARAWIALRQGQRAVQDLHSALRLEPDDDVARRLLEDYASNRSR